MIGVFDDMNKGNVLIYFLYIHITFYENYMIESLESRLVFSMFSIHVHVPHMMRVSKTAGI